MRIIPITLDENEFYLDQGLRGGGGPKAKCEFWIDIQVVTATTFQTRGSTSDNIEIPQKQLLERNNHYNGV